MQPCHQEVDFNYFCDITRLASIQARSGVYMRNVKCGRGVALRTVGRQRHGCAAPRIDVIRPSSSLPRPGFSCF